MDTVFAKQQIESFVQDLNSAKPMPGGGSAAASCGAMGAALAGMSAHMTVGKKKYAIVEDRMKEVIAEAETLQAEMLDMAQEDADMYSLVSLKVTGACVRIMKLAYTTVTEGNRMMVTDGSASALLARACQQVAAYNVRINLGGVKDKAVAAEAEQLLERHLSEGERLQAEVLKEVDKRV